MRNMYKTIGYICILYESGVNFCNQWIDLIKIMSADRSKRGLKIDAKAKRLTKPRNQAQLPKVSASPYPPLCFHVNARPPEGYVYYFAYGIDMNPTRFNSYICRQGQHADRYWGLLFGFKLRFNKKGVDQDAGGFPNIEYEQNSSVEGTMYLIRKDELPLVDNSMGYPEYVEKVMLPVWFLNCTEPDALGVAQYCVPAVTYIARDLWTVKDTKGLSSEYAVRQCVHAADLLSPAYKEYMISQIS